MKIDNTPVSDNVVRIIKEKGYKQCAIARKAGYSRQVFGRLSAQFIRDKVVPELDAFRFASYCGMALTAILVCKLMKNCAIVWKQN